LTIFVNTAVFEVRLFAGVIEVYPRLTLVAMIRRISKRWHENSLYLELHNIRNPECCTKQVAFEFGWFSGVIL